MTRMSPAKFVAKQKNAPGGDAATSLPTEGAQMPTPEKEDMMSNDTPVLPLDLEADLTVRHMRLAVAGLDKHPDQHVRSSASAIHALADALERSLGGVA